MSISRLEEEPVETSLNSDMVSCKDIKTDNVSSLPEHNFKTTKENTQHNTTGRNEETDKLKDLALSNLDLIQQQIEHLISKDKTINDLKAENEMLKQRIHRMERRVSLTKPPKSDQQKPSASAAQRSSRKSSVTTPGSPRKRRRQESIDQEGRLKKKRPKEGKKKDKDKRRMKKSNEEEKGETSSPAQKLKKESSFGPLLARFEKLTLTSQAFYTAVGEERDRDSLLPPPTPQTTKVTLEVPKWTIRPYTSSYTLEGTENLSDDVFDRRHFRLAIDEKRRKRWDVQRIREQRQIERLKQREERRKQKQEAANNPTPITSFWPDPDEITDRLSLVVMDKIPVAVFGISIPHAVESEPQLWWQNGKIQIAKTKRRGKR